MSGLSELFRNLFGKGAKSAAPSFANAPRAVRPVAPVAPAEESRSNQPPVWQARPEEYWQQRTTWVLQRLANEWHENPDAARWPDVDALLALLSEEPDAVIRQLPAAARDAMALCDSTSLSRTELADKLGGDPSLMQALLRQANGAWFGAGLQPVLRVDSAIDRIGIVGTRSVVLASCVDGLLAKPGGAFDTMVGAVWSHMVQTGPLARGLAPAFGADSEEAFSVALLHDVGKLVFFDCVSTLRQTRRRQIQLPDAWLATALEHLHQPLGAAAAHRWGLGPAAADAIGLHHRQERPSTAHPLAEVLFLAERADHARRSGLPLDIPGLWSLGELNGDQMQARGILGRHVRAAA
jgi:HD-like signal output (HDOD) protein